MGEHCIRNGDKQSSDKLDKRHFKAAYTGCGFVYQSNKGIAYSGGKPEENPFYRGQSAHLNACYNKHSGDRRRHAEDLYFSRVFKRAKGVPPSKYIAAQQASASDAPGTPNTP